MKSLEDTYIPGPVSCQGWSKRQISDFERDLPYMLQIPSSVKNVGTLTTPNSILGLAYIFWIDTLFPSNGGLYIATVKL
jgi:hypothetical protein